MPDVLGILRGLGSRAPHALELARALQDAKDGRGDPFALGKGALNLYQPGAGAWGEELASTVIQGVGLFRGRMAGEIIDGESTDDPTARAVKRYLLAQPAGGYCWIGPMHSGKTPNATRFAQVLHRAQGKPVRGVGMYIADRPPWVRPVSVDGLVQRAVILDRWVDAQARPDIDPDEIPPYPWANEILIVDEATLTMRRKKRDRDDEFNPAQAAMVLLAHCYHVGMHVIFIAQWASQIPEHIRRLSTLFIKRPGGDEMTGDYEDAFNRQLYGEAALAFDRVRSHPWYPEHPHVQAWTFARVPGFRDGHGFRGLLPFALPDWEETAA